MKVLSKIVDMGNVKTDILIGTSGYDYPEWKGVFYPENLKRKDFLLYYSTVFNALELNSTFYSMPTAERIMSFYERSEGRLNFSIKANRLLTHEPDGNWKEAAGEFRNAAGPLLEKGKLSALLFQFPQSFHYTPDNRIYLARLIEEFKGFPVLVEFRHVQWLKDSVFEGLEKFGASLVYCDMPHLSALPDGKNFSSPFVGPNAYIRLHGRNEGAWYCAENSCNGSGRYRYDYSDEELAEFVPVITRAEYEGRRVQVYFNNHPDGSGAKNAKRMREII